MDSDRIKWTQSVEEDMRFIVQHVVRTIMYQADEVLYKIAPDVCMLGPTQCGGKLITSLQSQGRNYPVCQDHYGDAMRDSRVQVKSGRGLH